ALATLPTRAEIAGDRFHQAQLKAALETLRVAAQTRRAYYNTVAALALVRFLAEATASAQTAAQLSRRLGESGAMNKLDQARDQVFYADLTAETASARRRAVAAREELVRWIGVWVDFPPSGIRLPYSDLRCCRLVRALSWQCRRRPGG